MPSGRLRLAFAPTPGALSRAGVALRGLLDECYGPDSQCHDIELAAVELLANIARHGRRCSRVVLRCTCGPRGVRVLAADDGMPVDMTRLPARLPEDLLAGSGRGLWIIARCAHRFRYRRLRTLNVHCVTRGNACGVQRAQGFA